jgi:tetratricopeptide (TPR) repeat protein
MTQRPLIGAGLIVAILAAGCASPPDSKQKTPQGPQFGADYYSKNAKEYYEGGRYGPAKDQWQKQLQKEPDNWMAKLGIAYCDYFMADQLAAAGDYAKARTQVEAAEKGFREAWSGHLEADTAIADCKRPEWRAALGLAMAKRKLGVLDHIESNKYLAINSREGPGSKAGDKVAELQLASDSRYAEAIGIFSRLASMEHASPEAIKNLGELYIVTKNDAAAEAEFKRYLDMAARTRTDLEAKKGEVAKQYGPSGQECATKLFDEKLASNAEKQVSVMISLSELAWVRGDYPETQRLVTESMKLQPDRKDLYLKLAEAENKLNMKETALVNVNEFLKRSSASRTEFDDDIRHALKLKQEIETDLKNRGTK